MLPVSARLTSPHDFARTTKSGLRVTTQHFVGYLHLPQMAVSSHADENSHQSRAGLIIGKSVGGSVRRHRVSRQIRHTLAPLLPQFPAGSLIVIRGLKASEAINVSAEVIDISNRLIERAKKRMANAS